MLKAILKPIGSPASVATLRISYRNSASTDQSNQEYSLSQWTFQYNPPASPTMMASQQQPQYNTNCQSPNTVLQLICFILYHVFTFDNQFFIQTHGTAMGTKFAPQYANIFMHRQRCPETRYIGETEQRLRQRMNGHHTTINRQEGSLPVEEHFSGSGHWILDLQVTILQGGLRDRKQRKVAEQRLTAKFRTHRKGLIRDFGFMSHTGDHH
ncbi:uncharacterized protein [Chiloscyllium punctatum]|uniref:uncharacterized protein n=1 Tax=Chiloscyllium punctatum TaxID=137246 RepID=UPI003B634243